MTQYLPFGRFRWITQEKINKLDVSSIRESSQDGYLLEVDLEYPEELQIAYDQE